MLVLLLFQCCLCQSLSLQLHLLPFQLYVLVSLWPWETHVAPVECLLCLPQLLLLLLAAALGQLWQSQVVTIALPACQQKLLLCCACHLSQCACLSCMSSTRVKSPPSMWQTVSAPLRLNSVAAALPGQSQAVPTRVAASDSATGVPLPLPLIPSL